MFPGRTELEWTYHPSNFFEGPYRCTTPDFDLVLDAGKALATLSAPVNPVSQQVEEQVKKGLEGILLVRQLQVHRQFKLEGPNTYQHSATGKSISVRPEPDNLFLWLNKWIS